MRNSYESYISKNRIKAAKSSQISYFILNHFMKMKDEILSNLDLDDKNIIKTQITDLWIEFNEHLEKKNQSEVEMRRAYGSFLKEYIEPIFEGSLEYLRVLIKYPKYKLDIVLDSIILDSQKIIEQSKLIANKFSPIPHLNFDTYKQAYSTLIKGNYIVENQEVIEEDVLIEGNLFVNGHLTVKGNLTVMGNINVIGNLSVSYELIALQDIIVDNGTLYAGKSITFKTENIIDGGISVSKKRQSIIEGTINNLTIFNKSKDSPSLAK